MMELRYETAKPEHKDAIVEFLFQYFMIEEPITKAVRGKREDLSPLFEDMVRDALRHPVSFVVFNATNEIVGCRLSTVIDMAKKRRVGEPEPDSEFVKKCTNRSWDILNFLDRLEAGAHEMVPLNESQLVLKFLIVSVRPDYYRMGIAAKSIEMSIEAGKKLGCTVVTVTASAFKSQQLFDKKLGFKTLKVVQHSDYIRADGERILNCDDGTTCGMLMFKSI